jgi:hypothetical protein
MYNDKPQFYVIDIDTEDPRFQNQQNLSKYFSKLNIPPGFTPQLRIKNQTELATKKMSPVKTSAIEKPAQPNVFHPKQQTKQNQSQLYTPVLNNRKPAVLPRFIQNREVKVNENMQQVYNKRRSQSTVEQVASTAPFLDRLRALD